jgi:hypothetical protein
MRYETVAAALTEAKVKFRTPTDLVELVALAEKCAPSVDAAGLAKFILEKSRKARPETVQFFLKRAVPEDLGMWAQRNAAKLSWVSVSQHAPCPRCGDTGRIGEGAEVCSCIAGLELATATELTTFVYTIGSPCRKCLATLRWQTKRGEREGLKPSCAFCTRYSLRMGAGANPEDPAVVAGRMNARVAVEPCKTCSFGFEGQTGIARVNWGTVEATASFCSCGWGVMAAAEHPANYPETLAEAERDWIATCDRVCPKKIA